MSKLFYEGLTTDGGFHLTQLLKDANARLKSDGRHGKTCQLKRSGKSITLQFNFDGQQNKGCGCRFTAKGIERAEQIARLVTSQLVANNFTWAWYDRLMGKKDKTPIAPKNLQTSLEEYKKNWFKENKKLKNPTRQWYAHYRYIENYIQSNCEESLNETTIKNIVSKTPSNSHPRKETLNALINFCSFFGIDCFNSLIDNFKKKNKIPKKIKYVPNDREIEFIYKNGFFPKKNCNKLFLYRYPQWQFLYSLLAIYGLRVHEAWNLANWDTPVRVKQGDWVEVGDFNEEDSGNNWQIEKDFVIPAILDPNNKDKILCIKHATKTGYRMAIPLSPSSKNWIEEFNLIQPLNLPDIPDPLSTGKLNKDCYNCSHAASSWFKRYDFTAHALRHAYNHRGHSLGINPTLLAQSLGHSLQVNSSTYLKTMPESRKLENFKNAISEQINKQSELERLQAENIALKAKVEFLETKLSLLDREQKGNL